MTGRRICLGEKEAAHKAASFLLRMNLREDFAAFTVTSLGYVVSR
jgi:hypothetical protein